MKKIFSLSLFLFSLVLNSCLQFLEPGYWQQMAERMGSRTSVSSMPDVSKEYNWVKINLQEAEELWNSESYRGNLKNPPASVTVYQPNALYSFYKFSDCEIERFPNYIYSTDIAPDIYVYAFESDCYGENTVALNRYIPSILPEESVIYKAEEDSAYVKIEIPKENESGEEKREMKTCFFKNGMLVQQKNSIVTFVDY